MKYKDLIDALDAATMNSNWLELGDYLTEDFHFITPLIEIKGKVNYIEHQIERDEGAANFTILYDFCNVEENKYYQIFQLESMGSTPHSVVYHQEYHIRDGLICRSILTTNQLTLKIVEDIYPNLSKSFANKSDTQK